MSNKESIGCGTLIQIGFMVAVVAVFAGGAFLYYQVPKWLQTIDEEAVPWVERKGRALIGKVSLGPLFNAIEASDLSAVEKETWQTFVEEKWEIAYKSDGKLLDRETMIELARTCVASRSGYCYALRYMSSVRLKETSLDRKQQRLARDLMRRLADGLRDGHYTVHQLQPVRGELLSVAGGWRSHDGSGADAEQDANMRDVCRRLLKIAENQQLVGGGAPIVVVDVFREELATFRRAVEAAEATAAANAQRSGDSASRAGEALYEGANYGNLPKLP